MFLLYYFVVYKPINHDIVVFIVSVAVLFVEEEDYEVVHNKKFLGLRTPRDVGTLPHNRRLLPSFVSKTCVTIG